MQFVSNTEIKSLNVLCPLKSLVTFLSSATSSRKQKVKLAFLTIDLKKKKCLFFKHDQGTEENPLPAYLPLVGLPTLSISLVPYIFSLYKTSFSSYHHHLSYGFSSETSPFPSCGLCSPHSPSRSPPLLGRSPPDPPRPPP
jgi:hypothetical protein